MKFDKTEKNAITHFFNCPFEELKDLFKIKGGLTKEFVKNGVSSLENEIIDIAGFCSPTHSGNLIIVSLTNDRKFSYCVDGRQAIMRKIPLFLPLETQPEAANHSMTS